MSSSVAFTVDDTADHTESGTSRYGAYLTHHQHLFRDADIPTTDLAEFAIAAWRVALPPIMTPSYLRPHPRVQGSDAHWDEEHRPALLAHLALPAPGVAHRLSWRGRSWTHPRTATCWVDPEDNSAPTVLATLTVRIPIPLEVLPTPRYRLGVPDTTTAKGAVRVLCAVMNAELAGVLDELDHPGASR